MSSILLPVDVNDDDVSVQLWSIMVLSTAPCENYKHETATIRKIHCRVVVVVVVLLAAAFQDFCVFRRRREFMDCALECESFCSVPKKDRTETLLGL